MISDKADKIDKKTTEKNNITYLSQSIISEGNRANFEDFTNFENIDFSDIITSSSKFTQSISDADLLLNELSSKIFQSEGYYSTLLYFFEQMKMLIHDQDPNIANDDTTVSLTCKSIIDRTIKLQDENIQMKLSLQKFTNVFAKDLTCTLPKDESVSYYTHLIDELIKRKNDQNALNSNTKNDQNTFNSSSSSINNKNDSINKDQQKIAKMTKIINDLKEKVEKMKKQKYLSNAGIKRIERQLLINDSSESSTEDGDAKYDKIVNEIKKLQEKSVKSSKVYKTIMSNFADQKENENEQNDVDAQIVKIFLDLKKEINNLKKENTNLFTSLNGDKNANNIISKVENDLNGCNNNNNNNNNSAD